MKILIINGQNHKGTTQHIATELANKVGGEIREIFLPRDFSDFCCGCTNCFMKTETACPHYDKLKHITDAIMEADLLILASPVYVYHATAGMKNLLDHYGYLWMVHRPDERMFRKQAVCISTAAGAGMKHTIKDMNHSLFFWGVPKRYKIGLAVFSTRYSEISQKVRRKIDKATTKTANKINKTNSIMMKNKVRIPLKTKGLFFIMHLAQRKGLNPADKEYWQSKGWTKKNRPWKTK